MKKLLAVAAVLLLSLFLFTASQAIEVLDDHGVILSEATTSDRASHELVPNDDYCDDTLSSTDETRSSACSFFAVYNPYIGKRAGKQTVGFECSVDGLRNTTIPLSRVNDGVCDCCDGSDEQPSLSFSPSPVHCPNTCSQSLSAARRDALAAHRNIQAGLRARTDLLQRHRQTQEKQTQAMLSVRKERRALVDTLLKMQFLLQFEREREAELRWTLIYERLHRCASGFVETCDALFSSSFLNDQELMDEGIPGIYINPKKRFVYEYSAAEKEALARSSGLDRVQQAICPVRDLLPDDDTRIYTRTGEYLRYRETPAGALALSPKQRSGVAGRDNVRFKRERTLFGKFLEDGDKGRLRFSLSVSLTLGVIAAPLTVPLSLTLWAVEKGKERLWRDVKKLAEWEQQEGERHAHASWKSAVLTRLSLFAQQLVSVEREGSPLHELYYNTLDPSQFSLYVALRDTFAAYLSPLQWFWDVSVRAPSLFVRYYVLRESERLPARRHACLLREGIAAAQREMALLDERIRASEREEERQKEERERERKREPMRGRRRGRDRETDTRTQSVSVVDWGADGAWEALSRQCVHRLLPEIDSSIDTTTQRYNYSLCLFERASQSLTLLGRFHHWGPQSPAALAASDVPNNRALGSYLQRTQLERARERESERERMRGSVSALSRVRGVWRDVRTFVESFSALPETLSALLIASPFSAYISSFAPSLQRASGEIRGTGTTSPMLLYLSDALDALSASLSAASPVPVSASLTGSVERERLWKRQLQEYYSSQVYDDGELCAVRPGFRRRTVVRFECGVDLQILDVLETQTCEYEMRVSCPLACTPFMEEESLRELERLQVFGFSKASGKLGSL